MPVRPLKLNSCPWCNNVGTAIYYQEGRGFRVICLMCLFSGPLSWSMYDAVLDWNKIEFVESSENLDCRWCG